MRVITCASYYGTGSSAVTDLFTEFDNIFSLGDYEYRFLQEPGGIADLEYNVVENNHRHNSSDAIKTYIKYTETMKKMGYGGYDIFGNQFDLLTNQYINDITELKVHTWWNKDRTDKGKLFCFADRVYSFGKRLMTGNLKSEKRFSLLQNNEWGYYTTISEEDFLAATRRYVDGLLGCVNKENLPFVMVDQMVPPTNVGRYTRYFNDVKVVVVDRDPRDIYLLEKKFWEWGIIPVDNPEDYVKWFKITRKFAQDAKDDPEHVYRLQFEDLVYDYENTKKSLMDFLGVKESDHTRKRTKFNPDISIKNTNLKERIHGYEKDIQYIEENLSEFLYPFDKDK